jgi:hypothetical protein
MARFIAVARGSKGAATRLGTEKSGIHTSLRGWNSGVVVTGQVLQGSDILNIFYDGGSGGSISYKPIGSVVVKNGQPAFEPYQLVRQQVIDEYLVENEIHWIAKDRAGALLRRNPETDTCPDCGDRDCRGDTTQDNRCPAELRRQQQGRTLESDLAEDR